MALLTKRYHKQIAGVLECFDRVIISGMLPSINHPRGMGGFLKSRSIRIFDYPKVFALPLCEKVRANAERIAAENGLAVEFVPSAKAFRKEDRIKEIIKERGNHPGLVHMFSQMECCASFRPIHNKTSHASLLRYAEGKCLHYYFYFIDAELGLCYLRVPTWSPFRLQFYCNGHNWLAKQLTKAGIEFTQCDNTFVNIADFERAQALCDGFSADLLQPALKRYSAIYCPVADELGLEYYWTLKQVEYATDIVFYKQSDLAPIYQTLVHTAIHSVKPADVATFLSRKLHGKYEDELGNDFHTRIEGTRIKHHREVVHRDGTREMKLAEVKKTIHSVGVVRELMSAANSRYIAFISMLDDPSSGISAVDRLSSSVTNNDRTYRGFNVFDSHDLQLFQVLSHGEFNISGFRNSTLCRLMPAKTSPQMSLILKRLRLHGLIKKVGHTSYLSKIAFRSNQSIEQSLLLW